MLEAVIYIGIAMGFEAKTGRVLQSWFWPYTLGKLIAEAWEDRK